jgi:hypothetical protein
MAAWYETMTCTICAKTIGRRWFWQDKPRLVGRDGKIRDAAYVEEATASSLLATHALVCHDCYLHRFADVQALAQTADKGT